MRMIAVVLVALMIAGCTAKKRYPDSAPGWHTADYRIVFGRLQRVPAKDPDAPPSWILRYGYANSDKYAGKVNLTPGSKLVGYNGGELVEVHGALKPEMTNTELGGMWYQVDGIRLWTNAR